MPDGSPRRREEKRKAQWQKDFEEENGQKLPTFDENH